MTSNVFTLMVFGDSFSFEVRDALVNVGFTSGEHSGERWELALTDVVLEGYGVDPGVFRAEVRAGTVGFEVDYLPDGPEDFGPLFWQAYLSTDAAPEIGCEVFYPLLNAKQYIVYDSPVDHSWLGVADVPEPGSVYFDSGGDPALFYIQSVSGSQIQFIISPGVYDWWIDPWTGEILPMDPPIAPGVTGMALQIKFPAQIDPEPDFVHGLVLTSWNGVHREISSMYVDGGIRGDDGVWLIPLLTDEDHIVPAEDWSLQKIVNGFNDPDPDIARPMIMLNFRWPEDGPGTHVPIYDPFTDVGVWFYYCGEPPPPPAGEIGVAPPLRIYPRHDQSAMGTPRVFPKSPSRQHGNRVGPGSYT